MSDIMHNGDGSNYEGGFHGGYNNFVVSNSDVRSIAHGGGSIKSVFSAIGTPTGRG
jgi:hypothetical protein